jgi:hypothetical protein
MTTEEIVEIAIQGHASTRDAIRWAIQQEREACAQVCEDLIGTRAMARHCADAIRARWDEK